MTAPTTDRPADTGAHAAAGGADADAAAAGADAVARRVRRLSVASAKRVIDPDVEVAGHVGPGQVLPDDLLSVAGLDLDLTAEQRATLSREEVASITTSGILFEAVLEAGFAHEIATRRSVTDPRVEFLLHEIGEETRHQRLFIRMVHDLQPTAVDPLGSSRVLKHLFRAGVHAIAALPSLLYTLVLAGEEIPDLIQKRAAEHPGTDPFIREVNRYHRQEEARHLSYARAVLPEVWAESSWIERVAVRWVAPAVITGMFDMLIHPGVYEAVGLDGWATWKQVKASERRQALRREALRPVLDVLVDAGAVRRGRIPPGWRTLCGVDAAGLPLD